MRPKDNMSESTTDTGQAELAPDPSMEDILASIRKIIADDDQTVDEVMPDPLSTTNEFSSVSDMVQPETPPVTLVSDKLAQSVNDDLSGDVMDLDIEALLNDADRTVESETPQVADLAISGNTGESKTLDTDTDALFDMVELELSDEDILSDSLVIPDIPEAPEIVETIEATTTQASVNTVETSVVEGSLDSETDDDSDSLFSDLESLLAEGSDDDDINAMLDGHLDTPSEERVVETQAVEAAPDEMSKPEIELSKPIQKTTTGLFAAGLAAVGLTKARETVSDNLTIETDAATSEEDDDLNAILSDLGMDQPSSETREDLTSAIPSSGLKTDGNDMDLVKSLMADLTEPEPEPEISVAPQIETKSRDDILAENGLAPLQVEEMADEGLEIDPLDDILDMSLDDEIKAHQEELASVLATGNAAEISEELESIEADTSDMIVDPSFSHVVEDEQANLEAEQEMSLLDIAASAEQEAERIENLQQAQKVAVAETEIPAIIEGPSEEPVTGDLGLETGLTAGVLSAAAVLAATKAKEKREETPDVVDVEESVSRAEDDVSKYVVEVAPVSDKTSEEISDSQKEPADMPRAATAERSDAILDDVTETATSEVFASLNQVVEEKAIQAERGDRVGDLVMEALRPMLKEWLDANLKGIVERAVSKEVKRISSGK